MENIDGEPAWACLACRANEVKMDVPQFGAPCERHDQIRPAKAAALREAARFFLAIDMPAAADRCEEMAISYEAPSLRHVHVVSDTEDCWCEPTVVKVEGR